MPSHSPWRSGVVGARSRDVITRVPFGSTGHESTLAQSSARGLSRDYPMMNTATIAASRGSSVSRKKAIPSSIA